MYENYRVVYVIDFKHKEINSIFNKMLMPVLGFLTVSKVIITLKVKLHLKIIQVSFFLGSNKSSTGFRSHGLNFLVLSEFCYLNYDYANDLYKNGLQPACPLDKKSNVNSIILSISTQCPSKF